MTPDDITNSQLDALGYRADGSGKRHQRPLLVCDVDEVVLHLVDPFVQVLDEMGFHLKTHSFKLTGNVFHRETGREASQQEVWQALDILFKEQDGRQHLVDGAADALNELSEHIDILFLTNMPHQFGDIRRQYLNANDIKFPLVTNTKRKTPAIGSIQAHCDSTIGFIDDTPLNLHQVRDELENVHLFHFMANEEFRKMAGEIEGASSSTGNWTEAANSIKQTLTQSA